MRILAFGLALLLLAGTVDPTRGWLITLTVLTGLVAVRLRPWAPFALGPHLDVRLGAFVLSALLLAGTLDANRDWLLVLSAVTGVAAFMPGIVSVRLFDQDRGWDRWTRRWERSTRRWERWGDDWS